MWTHGRRRRDVQGGRLLMKLNECSAVQSSKSAHGCSEHERARHTHVSTAPRVAPSVVHPDKPRHARRRMQYAEMNEVQNGGV